AERPLSGTAARPGGVSFTAPTVDGASAFFLAVGGVALWRFRRRWAARLVSFFGLLAGLAAIGVAAWVAAADLVDARAGHPRPGLFVLAAAGAAGALAAAASSRRLRPPLATS